jgi:dipeptide/tripeptide permease
MFLFFSILYDQNETILSMALIALFLVIRGYNNEELKSDKRTALKILIMIFYGAVFFSLTVQCYFSLNLAIENFVIK